MKPGKLSPRPQARLLSAHCLNLTVIRPDLRPLPGDDDPGCTLHMCLLVAGLWHGAISKSCPVCVPALNLSLSLAASQTPKSIPPGKESPPLTSAQALRAMVTTILPGQRAAGCEWRGPHQPKGLAETQGCGEWDGERGCPSKAMSDLGWGWRPGTEQGTLPLGDQTWAPTAYATPA